MSRRLTVITEIIAPYRIPVLNALSRVSGIDLHVIFLAENNPAERQWLVYKDEINFSCQVLSSWRVGIGRNTLLLNWGLAEALRKAAPEAILCGGYNYLAAWKAWAWSGQNQVSFFLWAESNSKDLRSEYSWNEYLKTKFLGGCDGFVVPGKSSFDYLRKYGARSDLIFTAPNAVDTEFFARRADLIRGDCEARQRLGLPGRYFLYVGRLLKEKGVFDLLEAYRSLTPKISAEVALAFVGDGPARAELEREASGIRCGSVRFAGFVQREHLPAYYALADCMVFPTHSDPWGLVVNEAMACGLPVICSRAAGCADDLITDGWSGLLVTPRRVGDIASGMTKLADNATLRAEMGIRSRERIARFSPENCAAGMAEAVRSNEPLKHGLA
jgi:glycosyltransferase involved in cell wall biosynthesis